MKKITIYTDGSSKGNPGPGGWAALVMYDRKTHKLFGSEPNTTNNRMELLAVIKAFEWVRENFKKDIPAVLVRSDSDLIIKTMNEGWKTKKNTDLWAQLGEVTEGLTIKWEWVKGHAKNKYNNECDRLAQEMSSSCCNSSSSVVVDSGSGSSSFFCEKCQKETPGILSQKSDESPIRVDCTFCGKYIKFAPKTEANLKRIESKSVNLFSSRD